MPNRASPRPSPPASTEPPPPGRADRRAATRRRWLEAERAEDAEIDAVLAVLGGEVPPPGGPGVRVTVTVTDLTPEVIERLLREGADDATPEGAGAR